MSVIYLAQYVHMYLYGCIVKERTAITEEILTAGSSSSLCNHKNLNREIIISVHIKLIHLVVRVCAKKDLRVFNGIIY